MPTISSSKSTAAGKPGAGRDAGGEPTKQGECPAADLGVEVLDHGRLFGDQVGPESAKEGVDNIVRFTRGPDELEFEEFVEVAHRFNQRRTLENIRERMGHRLKPAETPEA